jgi:hypothetical protein
MRNSCGACIGIQNMPWGGTLEILFSLLTVTWDDIYDPAN